MNPTASWDKDNFEVNGQYDLTTDSTVNNADTTTYEYSADGDDTYTGITDGASWDTTGLDDGDVRITAEDDQGNSDTAETTVTVDNNNA